MTHCLYLYYDPATGQIRQTTQATLEEATHLAEILGLPCIESPDPAVTPVSHYMAQGTLVPMPVRPGKQYRFDFMTKTWTDGHLTYADRRRGEYPPLADLADALYWQSQGKPELLQQYLAKIEAVKDRYPKPSQS
jgi:hypothetical protein